MLCFISYHRELHSAAGRVRLQCYDIFYLYHDVLFLWENARFRPVGDVFVCKGIEGRSRAVILEVYLFVKVTFAEN